MTKSFFFVCLKRTRKTSQTGISMSCILLSSCWAKLAIILWSQQDDTRILACFDETKKIKYKNV